MIIITASLNDEPWVGTQSLLDDEAAGVSSPIEFDGAPSSPIELMEADKTDLTDADSDGGTSGGGGTDDIV